MATQLTLSAPNTTAATVGYEAQLWQMVDALRGSMDAGEYEDVPGFCKAATLEEIRKHDYVLTPGRYVGAEAAAEDEEPFEEKMPRLVAQWRERVEEARRFDESFVQQAVAQIPWGHNVVLLDKVKDHDERAWYISKTIEHGWSRNVLVHQIETGLYRR